MNNRALILAWMFGAGTVLMGVGLGFGHLDYKRLALPVVVLGLLFVWTNVSVTPERQSTESSVRLRGEFTLKIVWLSVLFALSVWFIGAEIRHWREEPPKPNPAQFREMMQ